MQSYSETDIDIYSDLETVSIRYECDEQASIFFNPFEENLGNDIDDSDSDSDRLVIDTDCSDENSQEHENTMQNDSETEIEKEKCREILCRVDEVDKSDSGRLVIDTNHSDQNSSELEPENIMERDDEHSEEGALSLNINSKKSTKLAEISDVEACSSDFDRLVIHTNKRARQSPKKVKKMRIQPPDQLEKIPSINSQLKEKPMISLTSGHDRRSTKSDSKSRQSSTPFGASETHKRKPLECKRKSTHKQRKDYEVQSSSQESDKELASVNSDTASETHKRKPLECKRKSTHKRRKDYEVQSSSQKSDKELASGISYTEKDCDNKRLKLEDKSKERFEQIDIIKDRNRLPFRELSTFFNRLNVRSDNEELKILNPPFSTYRSNSETPPEAQAKFDLNLKQSSPRNINGTDEVKVENYNHARYSSTAKFEDVYRPPIGFTRTYTEDISKQIEHKIRVRVKFQDDELRILDPVPNPAIKLQMRDKFFKKLDRLRKIEDEVRIVLQPYFQRNVITKEEFKYILRRCVLKVRAYNPPSISRSGIQKLIEKYLLLLRKTKTGCQV